MVHISYIVSFNSNFEALRSLPLLALLSPSRNLPSRPSGLHGLSDFAKSTLPLVAIRL
jgi:hypothetical protein